MAHCYSDLSRLPAKVEQGGYGWGGEGAGLKGMGWVTGHGNIEGRQREREREKTRRMATRARWRNIFNGGCLGWSTARRIVSVRRPVYIVSPSFFPTLFSHLPSSVRLILSFHSCHSWYPEKSDKNTSTTIELLKYTKYMSHIHNTDAIEIMKNKSQLSITSFNK